MHLPAEALELSATRVEDVPIEPGRRSRAHAVASGFATASSTVLAEPRHSVPGTAQMPSPFHAPVERASGLAGGSQPIPPPRPFASRATASSAPPLGVARPTPAPQVTPRQGYAAATPPIRTPAPYEAPYLPPATATVLEPAAPTRAHRGLYMGCGMALVGIIVMLVMTIVNGDEPSPPVAAPSPPVQPAAPLAAPAASAEPPRAPPPPHVPAQASDPTDASHAQPGPAMIKIHVISVPPAAEVRIAGTPVGATPLDIQVPRKAGRATVTVHHARFQDATASFDLGTDYSADFKLTAIDESRSVQRLPQAVPKRLSAPPGPKRSCQPPDRYNPYDDSCGGKPCPRC